MNTTALFWLQMQIAADVVKIMDTRVDPCTDFYQFACGNYKNLIELPDDKSSMQRFVETDLKIKKDLKAIFEELDEPLDAPSNRMVRQFYRSCMDEQKLEELGVDPLRTFLKKYGGWPVVEGDRWNPDKYSWMEMNAKLFSDFDYGDIISFFIDSKFKDSLHKYLYVDQAALNLYKREYYVDSSNQKYRDAYYQFMVDTAMQLGASRATAENEMRKVLDFEIELAQISVRDEDRRDNNALYRPMSVRDLKLKYPQLNFDGWFQKAAEYGLKLNDSDVINLSGQPYLDKLPDVLARYSTRTLANFQIWSLAYIYVSYLAPSLREPQRRYNEAFSGTSKIKPRWEECVGVVRDNLRLPVGSMYVARFFSKETKAQLDTMMSNIRQAMKNTIDNVDWMDVKTKNTAQKKLSEMVQHMAFPPEIFDESYVMRDYRNVPQMSDDTYLMNKVAISQSSVERWHRDFRSSIFRGSWGGSIAAANAWYNNEMNKMTFPAGILRYPWFDPMAPDYYNYGHIGILMGHELTHGFDDEGRQYDQLGNFELWWTNKTLDEFKNHAKCFVDEYGHMRDPTTGQFLNGENTQGENIADNGGLRLSLQAYHTARLDRAVSSDPRNVMLPDLPYTADQLFFLSFAQNWCTTIRYDALRSSIISDRHSPGNFRANVPLQNNNDFAQAFNCAPGTPMNPYNKCRLW